MTTFLWTRRGAPALARLAHPGRWGRGLALAWLWAGLAAAPGVGAQQQHQPPPPLLVVEQGSHSAPVRRIDVNAARALVVTASDDRSARLWDSTSGELRHILRPPAFGAEGGRLYGAAFHPQQPLVAVGGTTGGESAGENQPHSIYLFDTDTGALRRAIDARAGDVRKLLWSHDGAVLVAGYAGANGLKAFGLDGRLLFEDAFAGPVFGLAVSGTGVAAAVSLAGDLRTYRVQAGAVTPLLRLALGARRAAGVAFSPDGRTLAVAYAEATVQPNGRESRHAAVELFEAGTGRLLGALPAVPVFGGDLRVLAWSADGRWIHAAGTAYTRDARFLIVRYDAAARQVAQVSEVAGDSITDLVALPSGGVAWGSFDGAWGVLGDDGRLAPQVAPTVSTVRGDHPEDLALSADARAVRWGLRSVGGGLGFQFERRRLARQPALALRAPETSFSLFDRPGEWHLAQGRPTVAGKRLELAADERSRALVVLRRSRSAVIGTNRAIYHLDDQGSLRWRVPVDTEVRALNASEDGRLLVSAMADGTIRWWRAEDGRLLLSLYAEAGGQWVLWTPSGYYDASAGADRLVGWAVSQGPQRAMAFYSLNRLRERFNRPDLIDTLLDTLDERTALQALAARDRAARDQAVQEAASREQAAATAARAASEALEQARLAAERELQARQEAERATLEARRQAELSRLAEAQLAAGRAAREQAAREQAARDQAARDQAARSQAARDQAAQEQAARDAAERERARRLAEAREAAEREAASQRARAEAERQAARLAAEQATAARLAAAAELAAAQARLEAKVREEALAERRTQAVVKALELPPALSAPENKRIRLAASEVTLPFAVNSPGSAASVTVEVRINGRPAQPAQTVLPASLDGTSRGYTRLSVGEGESLVEILAHNPYGVSEPLSFRIERLLGATATGAGGGVRPPTGDLYVLAIGVSDYQRAEYRLGLAAKDAQDFAQALKQQEGRLYRKVIVRTLVDREATRTAITQAFDALRQAVGPADVAMLFMAGHGLNDPTGQYFFLPADGQHERLAATGLPQAAIVSTLSRIRGKTLLFLDTCFAGNSLGALRQAGRKTEKMMNDLSSAENGVVVFASSTGHEESEEKAEWGNGAFTKALLEGLGGKADFTRAGRVTYAALNLFVSEEVTRLTQGRQRPVFISPRGIPDFALARL